MLTRLAAAAMPHAHLPHAVPSLSTDAIIIGVTALVFGYGVIAGYAALVRESISVYVGLVLANNFGAAAYHLVTHNAGGHHALTQSDIQLGLLIAPILILQLTRRHGHHGSGKHNIIVTLILAALAAMLVVSSVLSELSPVALTNATLQSNLASWIYHARLLWLGAVPIAIAVGAVLHPRPKKHRD